MATKLQLLIKAIKENLPNVAIIQIDPPTDPKSASWMEIVIGRGGDERIYTIRGQPHEPLRFDDSRHAPSGEASRERFETVRAMMDKLRALSKIRPVTRARRRSTRQDIGFSMFSN